MYVVTMSGWGLIIISVHCEHTVHTVGWHELYLGYVGQPKSYHRVRHQMGPS